MPLIAVIRPVRSPYRARASVMFWVEAPGRFVVENMALAGSKFVSVPNVICGTALHTVRAWLTCMNDPPKLRLCVPRSQLIVLSIFQLVVLRSSRPVRFPGEVRPNMLAAVKLQPNPPC